MSEHSNIIDEEQYNQLKQMFQSNDKETITLGVGILINCDWEKSKFWIIMLYTHVKFYQIHNISGWDNINVIEFNYYINSKWFKYDWSMKNIEQILQNDGHTLDYIKKYINHEY